MFVGFVEAPDHPNSFDQKFKRAVPWLYNNLNYIGFRVYLERDAGFKIIELTVQA